MKRYIITVDQAAIKREDPFPIHVHDTQTDERKNVGSVGIYGKIFVKRSYDSPLRDGARVWIETDAEPLTWPE